jgi:hypothetical protein
MTTNDFLEKIAVELHELNATLSVRLDQIEEQLHEIVEFFTDMSIVIEEKP